MAWSPSVTRFAPRAGEPTAAQKAEKAHQQAEYVRDLWLIIASIIVFLALIRVTRFLLARLFKLSPSVKSDQSKKYSLETIDPNQTRRASWRRVPSAIASAFRIVAFRCSIPIGPGAVASIAELTFILGYIIVMFVLLFTNTDGLEDFYYEDRAAHLASCQLPLIVALAGKNNIISFFTGVGHEKLNVLHRAAARTCLIFLWIHAICRASAGLPEKFDFSNGWMRWGATGLTAFTLATIMSIRIVRNMFFEFFLVSHIFLVGIFMIGGYLHAREPGFGNYIWPALVVWAFDRVLRFSRLLWNNSGRFGKEKECAMAKVELLSSDTIRLTLRRKFNWTPGQHAYVILPTVSDLPTEAHPFTIASIPKALDGTEGPAEKDVVFLIRGRSGFTGRLRDHAAQSGVCTVPAFVDGPYGCPPDLTKYSTCVLIAGGSGVSYTVPLLLNLVHQARANESQVRRVVFVWAIRDADHLKWISKILSQALDAAQSTSLKIEPTIYITGAMPSTPIPELARTGSAEYTDGSVTPTSPEPEKEGKEYLPSYNAPKITNGRPSIRRILQEEISASTGPVSVDVAGPSNLSQSVARVLASRVTSPGEVLRGSPSVTLHVETFGMTR
ncbi:hypothetical protein CERSUDRAFT_111219 [Gelatoporia subvermispora B]|uniref:ferric-chelate reductase (NADPH) n=1 Tax=Ceriporiopsis subvermispora (strain B) TaxID=914234 RepID=M2RP50_CERS8|nr:hypothetical protein CERSUDRAFT_111219 [Gelatoporia subvermispora B]